MVFLDVRTVNFIFNLRNRTLARTSVVSVSFARYFVFIIGRCIFCSLSEILQCRLCQLKLCYSKLFGTQEKV